MTSEELNWELTSASSGKDLAPAEGAATRVVWKILKSSLSLLSTHAKEEKTILRTRESRGTLG